MADATRLLLRDMEDILKHHFQQLCTVIQTEWGNLRDAIDPERSITNSQLNQQDLTPDALWVADDPSAPSGVMILDWDVHHGNGTQHIFQEDASVLYVSIHRYDHGLFFPCSEDAAHDKVGTGQGEGFNVNIPWNGAKMGDPEYLMAFHRVVMPIAYEFNPQLVLVSAGFDAARGDPLGGCQVTPEGYAHMTHLLMGLAGGRVVVVLEGGYNLTSISESMVMCTQTLLGDPPAFILERRSLRVSALRSLHNVLNVQRQYWHGLRLNVTVKSSHLESTEDQTTPSKNICRKSRTVESTGPSPHKPVTTADMGNTGAVALTSQHVEPEHSFDAPPSVTQEKDNSASLCLQNNVANELVRKVETPERIPLEGLEREGETLKNVLHEDIERENPECMSQKKPDNDDEILQGNLHEICASDTPGHLHHHEKQSPRSPSHQGLSEHYQHEELREGETTLHDLMRKCPIHNPYVQIVSKDCVCQSHQDTVTNRETLEVSQHALISLTDKEAHKHLVYERTEVKGETAEQDLPRAASPSEQLLDFKHLQLGDEMDNSSLVISLEDTPPWEGAGREAVLCKGGETRDKVANRCEKTSEETQMRLDLQNDDKLLSEAAGGCDTTLPSTLCQIFVDPLLGDSETGFAVLPLSWCPHLTSVREVPTGGLNVSQPCAECNTQLENWVCLTCYQVLCGRYVSKHMLLHGVTSGHNLVLSFSDISVWCYGCESYVHHEVLLPAKCSAYYDKFGEEMTII
ncbi:uncharacterized protein LOC128642666 [Bombina bombina]|uniref:uncharacterized protein LOC128642666 n=1 Tax=Bombina bombina TaxID=8345 RepID=UPI00235AE59F|nr:uncharacterized protein LOC128642666 [Bombina bombina]